MVVREDWMSFGRVQRQNEKKTIGVPLYSGPLSGFTSAATLGNINGGASKTYKVTVSFPNGTPAVDNPYQGSASTLDITFDAVQS